ncbi:myb/SANT-like DNA-binding domain-containing protein 3 [Prorops nasuta]|uniref:myb/SANT-like DNA-binding domain-containing protein 3 n=1 Tax=Prorops nasuta TaxID=863751 RepID=UPI0034CE9CE7
MSETIRSKYKHYTTIEKKLFLQILNNFKHIIENKRNDGPSLKEKDLAWNLICEKYNESTLINEVVEETRNMTQLKKLWRNLKQGQREALTKEKESHFRTGGGPADEIFAIVPDISNIAPNLMMTAPVMFSSNMTENEVIETALQSTVSALETTKADSLQYQKQDDKTESVLSTILCNSANTLQIENVNADDQEPISGNDFNLEVSSSPEETTLINNTYCKENTEIQKKNKIYSVSMKRKNKTDEEELKIARIKRKLSEEEDIATIKIDYEKTVAEIRKRHLYEIQELEKKYLKEKYALELKLKEKQLLLYDTKAEKLKT